MARILLADDQPHILRVIRLALARDGHEIEAVGDGRSALEKARAERYDVLITDVEMPHMDGMTLCETLNREGMHQIGLTLIITAQTDRELARRAGQLPNTDFLEKPLSLHKLKNRLQQHFDAATGDPVLP